MNHPDRAFSFAKINGKVDLIEAMFNHKWPLCYSFYHDKLLYLSDGESEDTPEYAVMTIDKTEGRFSIHGREVGRVKPACHAGCRSGKVNPRNKYETLTLADFS